MALIQFSGLASGIDSKALIDALVEARETTNELRRQEIDLLESTNDSLDELNTKILKLNDLVDQFRTINGGGVRKKAVSSDSSIATAVAGSNAVNGSYAVTVHTLADTATASIRHLTNPWSSLDDPLTGTDGDVIAVELGDDGLNIATTSDMTVQDFIDKVNSKYGGKLVASGINVGTSSSPTYQILLQGLIQGEEEGSLSIIMNFAAIPPLAATIDNASDLTFELGGVNGLITRSSNTVSDVISGVTLNFLGADSDALPTTITVSNDADATADLVNEIVATFNEIVEFINENDTVTRVEEGDAATNIFGSLAKSRVDNDFIARFREELIGAEAVNGSAVTSIAEMGIQTNRDGTLSVDLDDLKAAINSDSTGASEVLTDFADAVAGTEGLLYQFTKFNGFIDLAQQSNNSQIENLNNAINQLERQTAKMRESLERQFSRLEAVTAQLQSQQQALSGILAGLG